MKGNVKYSKESEIIIIIKYNKPSIIKKVFIFIILFCIFNYSILKKKKRLTPINDKFKDLLPKIDISGNDNINFLEQIFSSRQLFIDVVNLTNEYIHYIKSVNENEEILYNQILHENVTPFKFWKEKRKNQYSLEDYYKLAREEKLINNLNDIKSTDKPLVSVIISSYNKENLIMKTVRSIQNQSLKNIEIIIVDDCSTDNSKEVYKKLLEEDPRIRLFIHLKNQGVWKSRINGILYSRAKYFITFDMDDYYTDNYVLEDAFYLTQKYHLDSVKFLFFLVDSVETPYSHIRYKYSFPEKYETIQYEKRNFDVVSPIYGTIWNRLIRTNAYIKGLDLVDHYILNAYKNLWEDRWHNTIINRAGFSYLMINRPGYLYMFNEKGEGKPKLGNPKNNFKQICEFLYFWLFDFELLPKNDNKKSTINTLRYFNNENAKYWDINITLGYINDKFIPYKHLLTELINDNYVENNDKIFIKELLNKYYNITKNINKLNYR